VLHCTIWGVKRVQIVRTRAHFIDPKRAELARSMVANSCETRKRVGEVSMVRVCEEAWLMPGLKLA
jgi:hypothetical protein